MVGGEERGMRRVSDILRVRLTDGAKVGAERERRSHLSGTFSPSTAKDTDTCNH